MTTAVSIVIINISDVIIYLFTTITAIVIVDNDINDDSYSCLIVINRQLIVYGGTIVLNVYLSFVAVVLCGVHEA